MGGSTLTQETLAGLCARAFPERFDQRIVEVAPVTSRQHEMLRFELEWEGLMGRQRQALIARRYLSTLSWWRADDHGKAQREYSVSRWLNALSFPAPMAYLRQFDARGDVVLFEMMPGQDWSAVGSSFREVIEAYASRFGRLLARLHSIPPPPDIRAVLPTVTLSSAIANLSALAERIGLPELRSAVQDAISPAFSAMEMSPVLLHGDYHLSNTLLKDGEISGVIDWEFCAVGDPRWDVSTAYMQMVDFEAAGAADSFLNAYVEASGRQFTGPPIHNLISALQQWAVSEWIVRQQEVGKSHEYALADYLASIRDVHRQRAARLLRWLR